MCRATTPASVIWLMLFAAWPAVVFAALKNENLLAPLPNGFKLGYSVDQARMSIHEFVPAEQSVDDWSKMITVQIFHGMTNADPDSFAGSVATRWKAACAGGIAGKLISGVENGYRYSLWMFDCPLNPSTKRPENMWQKVISGADSLYSVQYAYRLEMNKDLIAPAMSYLRRVMVCDTRLADRRCPAGL